MNVALLISLNRIVIIMKIGILTQPLHINYGGLLQNYALQTVLKDMGHEVMTFDIRRPQQAWLRDYLSSLKSFVKDFFSLHDIPGEYFTTIEQETIIRQNTNRFIDKYINRTQPVFKKEDFYSIASEEKFDGYVVGSDQVWRPLYNSYLTSMFLDFVDDDNVKKMAYAASFGTSDWEYDDKQTQICNNFAKRFNLITVREKSGVKLCKEHFGIDATHVLDPTMLLKREDYERLVESEKEPHHKGGLFYYFLDPSEKKFQLIGDFAQKEGLMPFTVLPKYQPQQRTKEIVENHIEDCIYPSVTSWLRAFMDAEMVIGDSFHCAVFSIIFNKPFWVVSNSERGNARFASLLNLFHTEKRLIEERHPVNNNCDNLIDWENINVSISDNRLLSMNSLRSIFS